MILFLLKINIKHKFVLKIYIENNKYLADCEKFGFTPLDKNLISIVNIENNGVPVAFSKTCGLVGNPYSDDLEIINV